MAGKQEAMTSENHPNWRKQVDINTKQLQSLIFGANFAVDNRDFSSSNFLSLRLLGFLDSRAAADDTAAAFLRRDAFSNLAASRAALAPDSDRKEAFENVCVEYDDVHLKPTFKILWGVPGRSKAINIAERLGMLEIIVSNARKLYGAASAEIDELDNVSWEDEKTSLTITGLDELVAMVLREAHAMVDTSGAKGIRLLTEKEAFVEHDGFVTHVHEIERRGRIQEILEEFLDKARSGVDKKTVKRETATRL